QVNRILSSKTINCCDSQMHVLAVTQKNTSAMVNIYLDGSNVGQIPMPGSVYGAGMSCIGGGFCYAEIDSNITLPSGELVHDTPAKGINTPNTFAYAANLFKGDISAVVSYADVLADGSMSDPNLTLPTIASVTQAFQKNADGQW
ncbi:MAG TPA: hypothetical protein VK476_04730, partial [Flavobacterium sp.]|nr:hypothetical protein [Flavobacterium sp.]